MKMTEWWVSQEEIERICGRFLLLGNSQIQPPCYVANYKDHADVFDGDKVDDGWGADADPEAHFYIRSWKWTFVEIADVMGVNLEDAMVKRSLSRYGILVVDVDGNVFDKHVSTHFEPLHSGKVISNPDPRLEGYPEYERRALPV